MYSYAILEVSNKQSTGFTVSTTRSLHMMQCMAFHEISVTL